MSSTVDLTDRVDAAAAYERQGIVTFLYDYPEVPGQRWQERSSSPPGEFEGTTTPMAALTGKRSNLVVVDIDTQNGGSLQALQSRYGEGFGEDTFTVRTASGGLHLYYRYPEGIDHLKRVISPYERVSELRGVDFLADKSHVIIPPTARVGHSTKPDGSYTIHRTGAIRPLPEAVLADWLDITEVRRDDKPPAHRPDGVPAPRSMRDYLLGLHTNNLREVREAPEGQRDVTCIRMIASSMRYCLYINDAQAMSVDSLGLDFMQAAEDADPSYEIRDLDGKITRARRFAEDHPWEAKGMEVTADIPEGIELEDIPEYLRQLRRKRIQRSVDQTMREQDAVQAVAEDRFEPFVSVSEFLQDEQRDTEWIIDRLFPEQGKIILAAEAKAGKTTMVMELIRALSTGTPFLGEDWRFPVQRPYRVALLDMEMARPQHRSWLSRTPGIDHENVMIKHMLGRGHQLDMRNERMRQVLAQQLREVKAEVLIVDPISPVMSALGVNEDTPTEVRPFLDAWDPLFVEAELKGLVIPHHTGHVEKDRSRGASSFKDWPTGTWVITKDQEENRYFKSSGRDMDNARTSLALDPMTQQLTTGGGQSSGPDVVSQLPPSGVTVKQAASVLGLSDDGARKALERAGYVPEEQPRRGVETRYHHPGLAQATEADPFA